MRLFIAIKLSDPVRDTLCAAIDSLKQQSVQRNFTHRENLHLTLAFLGETSRLAAAKQAMNRISAQPFSLTVQNLGKFRRDGGDIWWAGVKETTALSQLHRLLTERLAQVGFSLESRPFQPHLTLARQVMLKGRPDAFPPISMEVRRISLMKSERLAGRLTYTEVYAKELAPGD